MNRRTLSLIFIVCTTILLSCSKRERRSYDSKIIVTKEVDQKQPSGELNVKDYQVLKRNHNAAVQNFHVLLKRKKFDKDQVHQFIEVFRNEICTMNCNIYLYDSQSIIGLVDVYPLKGRDYIKVADHLISSSIFDATDFKDWYPYQDFHYKELGGRNWKKKPVR